MNILAILEERGFVENKTHEQELVEYLAQGQATCYIGFDPTASSLHVGSLIPIMALAHMQRAGHRPVALVGGGTGLVGDPSGKTEMRKLLTHEVIADNLLGIQNQLARFIDFQDGKALMVNNADWLTSIEYIPFLRDIGKHFSVNRMIRAESYKIRLESEEGLSFIEFNYMLLQAYDFMELFDRYGCRIQMGGSDQWGNIIAGVELVRKTRQETVFGITFPLITTSSGAKMGKTANGAVWLDAERTSPYDYYQFWINTDDKDVARFMALFTFLPMNEIAEIERLQGAALNEAKAVLAFETTRLAHGSDAAGEAFQAACSMFGNRSISNSILPSSTIPRGQGAAGEGTVPSTILKSGQFQEGMPVFKLFQLVGLVKSGGEARRLIQQGGAYMNGNRLDSYDYLVTIADFKDGEATLRAGKKRYHKVRIEAS